MVLLPFKESPTHLFIIVICFILIIWKQPNKYFYIEYTTYFFNILAIFWFYMVSMYLITNTT